jgi:hypothetical protein
VIRLSRPRSRPPPDAFAEYERLIIKARTRAALAAIRRRGHRVGTVPYGARLGDDGKTLVPDLAELAMLARLVELRRDRLSYRKAAEQLQREGFRPKAGGRFAASTLQRLARRSGDADAS